MPKTRGFLEMKIVKVSNWTDGRIFATLLVPKEHSRDNLRTGLLFPTMANECLSQLTKQSETRHTFPLIVRNSVTLLFGKRYVINAQEYNLGIMCRTYSGWLVQIMKRIWFERWAWSYIYSIFALLSLLNINTDMSSFREWRLVCMEWLIIFLRLSFTLGPLTWYLDSF